MLARINGRQLLTVMEKRRGERSGGCSESRLLGLIACRIYFPLQIYGGALMAAARELLRSFLLLKPSRSKSDEAPSVVLPKETRAGALGVFFALSSSSSHGVLHFTPCRKTRHSKPTRVGSLCINVFQAWIHPRVLEITRVLFLNIWKVSTSQEVVSQRSGALETIW
ncbi:hypothetical protein F2Q70_00018013 [Brassica cretica]|uniref:Uncharacterized protein n=1 Tax=Brassica cretica TaxID=69181 RepID=A0A8S9HTC4_BRACR|nr:hypothetical protein F2Q70_00018013 [Brassica cretica]